MDRPITDASNNILILVFTINTRNYSLWRVQGISSCLDLDSNCNSCDNTNNMACSVCKANYTVNIQTGICQINTSGDNNVTSNSS